MVEPQDDGPVEYWFERVLARDVEHGLLLQRLADAPFVTVVVPVHDGGPAVSECLASLTEWTKPERLLVIDDASTDQDTVRLLDRYASRFGIRLERHAENWGYTRTANHGIELAGETDVVLLNSDTVVGPMWLQRLRWVAYSMPEIASVTAASDNAGAMSLPNRGQANEWARHLSWSEIARHVAGQNISWAQKIPTAHGFCAYLRRSALDKFGGFDAEAFPRGYGEENDWSMRAESAGFLHVFAPHVMVKHARSQSFGEERQQLVAEGRAVIDSRWPNYTARVRKWLESQELAQISEEADACRGETFTHERVKPRRLYVLHRSSGGTPATNLDLMRELEYDQETYLLESLRGEACELSVVVGGVPRLIQRWKPDRPFMLREPWRSDYAAFVARILLDYNIELVHVRHLIHSPVATLPEVCRRLGVPFIYSTHDYHAICPTVQLLDENLHYCGGACTPGESDCTLSRSGLNQLEQPLKNGWVHEWRKTMSGVMEAADAVVATSPSAGATLTEHFPEIRPKLHIIEHGRDVQALRTVRAGRARKPGPLRVLAPAMWAPHKGIEYLRSLATLLGPEVEWHILGEGGDALLDIGIVHGEYSRSTMQDLTAEIDPDLVGLFSIWAETYAHTLTESWAMGLPVVVTDLGAPAARVRDSSGGAVVPVDDVARAAEVIRLFVDEPESVYDRLGPVPRSSIRTPLTMANEYRDLYVGQGTGRPRRIGVVDDGATSTSAWTRDARIHRPSRRLHGPHTRFHRISVADYVAGHVKHRLDTVLVASDSLPRGSVGPFLDRVRADRTRIVVDVDTDWLPASGTDDVGAGFSDERLDELVRLCRSADAVLASNDAVAERFARIGAPTSVMATCLDERLWSRPEEPVAEPKRKDEIRLLYLDDDAGLQGHLQLAGVPELLADTLGRPVVIEVVGPGANIDRSGMRRLRPRGHDHAEVVAWVRQHRSRWSAAVAPMTAKGAWLRVGDEKLLVYAALGLPAVASNEGEYGRAKPVLAVRVADTVDAWASALVELLSDTDNARRTGERARSWVLTHRMLSQATGGWFECVSGIRAPAQR